MSFITKTGIRKWLLLGVILIVIFLMVAIFVGLPRYISYQIDRYASNLEITQISLQEIGLTKLRVDVTVTIENPNPVGATIDRISYDMYFKRNDEWVYLGNADRTEDTAIGSHETAVLDVSNDISTLSAITMLLQTVGQKGTVDLKATGSVWIKLGPLSLEVPLEHLRTVQLW